MSNTAIYKRWIDGEGLERVRGWARQNMTDKQLAENIGITTVAFRKWKKRFPAFAEAINNAKQEMKVELEKSMFELATGKSYVDEIKTIIDPSTGKVVRVEKTHKQIPPSANLQTFLAKNWIPEKYFPPCWEHEEDMGE